MSGGESFGQLLRRLRIERGLSQNALARRARIDPSYVHRFERGDQDHPRRSVVERLAEALELDDLERARLLVSAGYWPFPELDDDTVDLALGVVFAIGNGDYRTLLETGSAQAAGGG